MDALISTILQGLASGAAGFLYALGWMLFLVERYYVSWRKDVKHREDLNVAREELKAISDKTSDTLTQFTALLAVINDRLGRGG